MYAGRAIPLGLATAAAVWIAPDGGATVLLLSVAVVAQLIDVGLGLLRRTAGMIVGAAAAVLIHLSAIIALSGQWQ